MNEVRLLWRGALPLREAFWTWAVLGGLLVNMATSLGFYFLIIKDQLVLAILIGYGLSLPYNFLAMVGVWRSANAYEGDRRWADAAKIVTMVGMFALSVT